MQPKIVQSSLNLQLTNSLKHIHVCFLNPIYHNVMVLFSLDLKCLHTALTTLQTYLGYEKLTGLCTQQCVIKRNRCGWLNGNK